MDISELSSVEATDPRLIRGIDYEEYARIPAIRSGVIKSAYFDGQDGEMLLSMAHLKYAYENQSVKDTDALLWGRAVHHIVTEWDTFEDTFTFYDGVRNTRHKAYQEFLVENGHKQVLSKDQWNKCMEAGVALATNKLFRPYVVKCEREITGIADMCGVPVKARFDILGLDNNRICDIKTSSSISPKGFYGSFKRFGYAEQMGLYQYVLSEILDGEKWPVDMAVVPSSPPYIPVVYEVPQGILDKGLDRCMRACEGVKRALETNEWPSFAAEPMALAVSEWDMADEVHWDE